MLAPDFDDEIEAILDDALQVTGGARRLLLDERCAGRPELRKEVDALLVAHEEAAPFFESPLGRSERLGVQRPAPGVGDRIGAFRLAEIVGTGGMGVVFRAERIDGEFSQQVAIKFIDAWSRDAAAARRFRAERQILASLQHPNIVSLLDGGVAPNGDAYLVMEYVNGQPITTYCQSHQLPIVNRLRLFTAVCEAVQHAHTHLVVHRDLKPANVLVTSDGVPKVLDFGVAKLLEPSAGAGATLTGVWPGPLTPNYASPEQLRGVAITTVSDVYALGVLLYELLCGARPYETAGKPLDELLALVVESEIAPLSARAQPTLPYAASELTGDLQAITAKALEKDPRRRYASAADLADDIARYLNGRPVLAQPDRAAYRARKFISRHRVAVAAAGAAVLSLIIGLAAALWQWNVARIERDRARLESAKAQQVSAFMRALFSASNPLETLGRDPTASELLDRGTRRIDQELSGQPDVQASMLASLGSAYAEMGLFQQAQPLLERSLAMREAIFGSEHVEVAESLHLLGRLKSRALSDYATAASLLSRAIVIRDRETPDDPTLAPVLSELGIALWHAGEYEDGRSALRRATDLGARAGAPDLHKWLANLALLEQDLGDFDTAEALLRRALDLGVKQTGRRGVTVGPTMLNLGTLLRAQEKFDEARALLEEMNADEERTWGQGRLYTWGELGELYFAVGEHDRARDFLTRAIAIGEKERATSEPYELSAPLLYLGQLSLAQDRPSEALIHLERSLRIRRHHLGEKHNDIAQVQVAIARTSAALGRPHAVEPLLREALAMQRAVLVPEHRYLVPTLMALGEALERFGTRDEARALIAEAAEIARHRLSEQHSHRLAAEAALRRLSTNSPQ